MSERITPDASERAEDEKRLAALSLYYHSDLCDAAIGDQLGVTRNAVIGWRARIIKDDAKAHGDPPWFVFGRAA
jgi:hypothetical protein